MIGADKEIKVDEIELKSVSFFHEAKLTGFSDNARILSFGGIYSMSGFDFVGGVGSIGEYTANQCTHGILGSHYSIFVHGRRHG